MTKLYFRQFYMTRKLELQWCSVDKGSGSGIFPDQDPADPKRPDPTGCGSATLMVVFRIALLCFQIFLV